MKRTVVAFLLVTALSSRGLSQTAPSAETVQVTRGSIHVSIEADGYFEPMEPAEIRIRPKSYQGDLKILKAAPAGSVVKAGDVILELDAGDVQHAHAEAQNALVAAQANFAKAKSDAELGEQADELAMMMAEERVKTAAGNLRWFDDVDGKEMLRNAELNVRRTRASVEDQADELDQLKKMYKTEELTNATADIVVKRAVRALELAQVAQQLTEARQGRVKDFDFPTARQRLSFALDQETQALKLAKANREVQSTLRKTALETARLALARAEEKERDLSGDVDAMKVNAPAEGTVYYGQLASGNWQNANPRQLRAHEKIAAGQVVMTICQPGQLRFVADVPEGRLNGISQGIAARIVPTGHSMALAAKVVDVPMVGFAKDASQIFPIKLSIAEVPATIRPGARGTIRFDAGTVENALLLPTSAISRGRVKVQSDGESVWREVVVGKTDGSLVEVVDGLSEGQSVLKEAK